MKNLLTAFAILLFAVAAAQPQNYNDRTLGSVKAQDKSNRDSPGRLLTIEPSVHMYRADVYMSNREFPSAREHWAIVLESFPESEYVSKAMFGMGRSNMWERNYEAAIRWFDRLIEDHGETLDGQEGLAFKGACHVRLGQNLKAVEAYEKYTVKFPFGKRIESSYLNIIDAYREDGNYDLANEWVTKTSKRFSGLPTETNAIHARLRMEVFRGNWQAVIAASNSLLALNNFADTMAYEYEVRFLKGYAFEMMGNKTAAIFEYNSIPANPTSYFGGLSTARLDGLAADTSVRHRAMKSISMTLAPRHPVRFGSQLLRYARARNVDPRFVLAIMKQESGFRPRAKSPAAARGLLQLTYDTALKYNVEAGYPRISGTDLYNPSVNIAIGSLYIAKLREEFGGIYEAIAASYNGGEDNSARWMSRTKPKEPGIFASEVGFSETKNYVFKVMGNYAVYKELYTEDLVPR